MFDDFNWGAFLILWGFTVGALWFVPPMMSMEGMGFTSNLVMTIALAGITYLIVGKVSNS